MTIGTTQQFKATATYADGTSKDVTTSASWSSGTPGVAAVDSNSGLVTALGGGTSAINATFNGMSGSFFLTVISSGSSGTSPTLTLALTDPLTHNPKNSISPISSATVTATLLDSGGDPISGKVITFTVTTPTMATLNPASGTALTDANGVATITLTGTDISGATEITGATSVGTTAVSDSIGFTVSSGPPVVVTMGDLTFGVNPLSAFGTTSVAVSVSIDGVLASSPQTVNFSSPCATNNKAVLSPTASTVAGVATASYRDNGCAGTDTITATVSGNLASVSADLTVVPPSTGSLQFVSASPPTISLKGTGGIESSLITFKVLDGGGLPISGKSVTFSLSTSVGGITLLSDTAVSDNNGEVIAHVNSGTVSTPVRVTATTPDANNVPIATQSSQLTISTGIPDQYGFSLSASAHNIEGWAYDGVPSVLTVRLADHFKNPVPDNTAVTFTAEGGSIDNSCITLGGLCTATFTSQEGRPSNGRIIVLAYAVGEETFTDLNGNGWADLLPNNEMIDPNGASTDLPEAWVDYNENGIRDANEPYIDFNGNGSYDGPDGKFSGILCDDVTPGRSSAGTCSPSHTIDVRGSQVIVLSTSEANITINGGVPIHLTSCDPSSGITETSFKVNVVDMHGNAMPAGTKVEFATTNGSITSPTIYTVPDITGSNDPLLGGTPAFGDITVRANTDATYTAGTPGTCTDSATSGIFTVNVTTPKGIITTKTATIID